MSVKLYVGNVSYDATEADLRELFEPFGAIEDFFLAFDRYTGRSRGFAFVTYEDDKAAEEAINKLNEAEFFGRNLVVNVAREKREGPGGGGGGGGGGRRGGGGGGGGWRPPRGRGRSDYRDDR